MCIRDSQNTSDGPPFEVREGGERQDTPQALAVNAMVDGIGWKFHLDSLGLPEHTLFGLCYGVGSESGFGGGGSVKSSATALTQMPAPTTQVNTIGPLKDSTVLGAMFDMPLPVSYTHLDVYKRQALAFTRIKPLCF